MTCDHLAALYADLADTLSDCRALNHRYQTTETWSSSDQHQLDRARAIAADLRAEIEQQERAAIDQALLDADALELLEDDDTDEHPYTQPAL